MVFGRGDRFGKLVLSCVVVLLLTTLSSAAEKWIPLGPDGGDARSLTVDPANPDRIFLGTSAGELFLSTDAGATWSRYAHLGTGFDYVLDNMAIDPSNPTTMYIAAWSIENPGGDLFRSRDGGKTWQALPGMHGKSIRAMALSASNSNTLVTGALDGVFRTDDAGDTWRQISPPNHAQIKNIESVAVDPKNPDVVYAGTWHLPWKTDDGGKSWHPINKGVIDDSDVFSIIIDPKNPSVVYASACSGIYKSESAGEQFHKVQGIPFSARRTRVLQQDPANSDVVYAGTTEGLWRTQDAGKSWTRISESNLIVNDVMIDPRNSSRVLIATDRSGVLASNDRGITFRASNRGFAHRQVTAVVADSHDPQRLYASVVNDKEFGGVFVSDDGGSRWEQISSGLRGRDVFTIERTESGALIVGTNEGVFARERGASEWKPINLVMNEKTVRVPVRSKSSRAAAKKYVEKHEFVKGTISGRVSQLKFAGDRWFAATSQGVYRSLDGAHSWHGGPVLEHAGFVAVDASGETVAAANITGAFVSTNGGTSWSELKVPDYCGSIFGVAVQPNGVIWIATRQGVFRTRDAGLNWRHIVAGTPASNLNYIGYDPQGRRLLALANSRSQILESHDDGDSWTVLADSRWPIRNVSVVKGRVLAVTDFDGIVAQPTGEEELRTSVSGGAH